jgi:hypothetical protein
LGTEKVHYTRVFGSKGIFTIFTFTIYYPFSVPLKSSILLVIAS